MVTDTSVAPLIFLFTDFGSDGPYLGQMESVLRQSVRCDVIRLLSNSPRFDAQAGSFLLSALVPRMPPSSIILGIVDPGVGGDRSPVVLQADGRWFVGPENGLFNTVAARAASTHWYSVDWRPARLAATFHGRDLFAPVAARIANNDFSWTRGDYPPPDLTEWPAELNRVIYVDVYGNAMTGRRYSSDLAGRVLMVAGHSLAQARTFAAVPVGSAFWYRNSMELVEIAVNRGSASEQLKLKVGTEIHFSG